MFKTIIYKSLVSSHFKTMFYFLCNEDTTSKKDLKTEVVKKQFLDTESPANPWINFF